MIPRITNKTLYRRFMVRADLLVEALRAISFLFSVARRAGFFVSVALDMNQ